MIFTSPTRYWGPSTTRNVMVTRAFSRSTAMSVPFHPRLDVAVVVVEGDDALDVLVEPLALELPAQDEVLALLAWPARP